MTQDYRDSTGPETACQGCGGRRCPRGHDEGCPLRDDTPFNPTPESERLYRKHVLKADSNT